MKTIIHKKLILTSLILLFFGTCSAVYLRAQKKSPTLSDTTADTTVSSDVADSSNLATTSLHDAILEQKPNDTTDISAVSLSAPHTLANIPDLTETETLTDINNTMMSDNDATAQSTVQLAKTTIKTAPQTPSNVPTDASMLNLSRSKNAQVKKLKLYQDTYGSFVTDRLMVFLNMPQTSMGIRATAQYIVKTSNEFATAGITPVFIFEPIDEKGAMLNLKKIADNAYAKNLDALFAQTKKLGATEKNLGIFVPYPEINTPVWNRKQFTSDMFPIMVNSFFASAKKYYPHIQGSILLDSKSYPMNDASWTHGSRQSFAPYVSGIQPEHIQSFGLQGFPWANPEGNERSYDAHEFLPEEITIEAAAILKTSTIWYNTGTYRAKYRVGGPASISPEQRQATLDSIVTQATSLQNKGFSVWINIFAENKMNTPEKTDWSYLSNQTDKTIFKNFLLKLKNNTITTSLFDH